MDNDLRRIHKELNERAREIPKAVKGMNGWAARVMKHLHIDDYADYPKRTGRTNF